MAIAQTSWVASNAGPVSELLLIFIIMTTASVQGVKVDLPKASNSPSLAKPQTKAITVREDGQIFLDTYPVTLQELEDRLRQIKAVNPNFPVVIKGDAKCLAVAAASCVAKVTRDRIMMDEIGRAHV